MSKPYIFPAIALLAILTACSDTPTTTVAKKEPEKPEPVTGQTAVFKMYQMARAWAPDAQVMNLQSMRLSEVKDGAPGHRARLAGHLRLHRPRVSRAATPSPSWRAKATCTKARSPDPSKAGAATRGLNSSFLMAAIKVDTDAAYKTAMETLRSHAAEYDKKNPGKPITIMLERTAKHPDPAWRIIWGESAGTSNFSVLIDASTGEYLETLR